MFLGHHHPQPVCSLLMHFLCLRYKALFTLSSSVPNWPKSCPSFVLPQHVLAYAPLYAITLISVLQVSVFVFSRFCLPSVEKTFKTLQSCWIAVKACSAIALCIHWLIRTHLLPQLLSLCSSAELASPVTNECCSSVNEVHFFSTLSSIPMQSSNICFLFRQQHPCSKSSISGSIISSPRLASKIESNCVH